MNKEQRWKRIVIILASALVLSLVYLYFTSSNDVPSLDNQKLMTTTLDNFASCLKNKDIKYYGSYTCSACAMQNKLFGDSKQYLDYIECGDIHSSNPDDWSDICRQEKIHATPTWIFPNGERVEGVMSIEDLSEVSGCKLR